MPSVAEILLHSGRSQADAKRREGQIAAQKWSTLGDVIGNSLNSYLREKQEAPARERANRIGELQLGEAEAAVAAREAGQQQEQGFQQTMGSGKGRDAILKSLESNPDLYKRASEHFERIDTGYKRLMGDVAAGVRSFGDDPEAALIAIDDLISKGFDERQMEQYRAAIMKDPQSVAQLVDGLLGQSPDEAHRKMVRPAPKEPGTRLVTRRNPDGSEIQEIVPDTPGQTFESAAPPKPMREVVVRGPNGKPVKKLVPEEELMRGVEQYEAPRPAAQPQYQRIETVDEAGNPIIQYMTPEEVRGMGGVRTSPKTTAKASGPATVDAILGEIDALSQKINTQGGGPIASATGLIRRGAASMNLDNEVSEYKALVEGFIPMVARAVGHTGVLTQADVDSVRALFPLPTDNKTLAQNKLERVRRIMSAMQTPGASQDAPDPLGIRK